MKICAHSICNNEFEPAMRQKFCSELCRERARRDRAIKSDPEYYKKKAQAERDYLNDHPEQRKKQNDRHAKRLYKSGKLPPWMFS